MGVELPVDVSEPRIDSSGNSGGACECDKQLRVLVAIAGASTEDLKRAWNTEGDPLRERIINPLIDPLGNDAWVALATCQPSGETHDVRVIALDERLGHCELGHHASPAVREHVRRDEGCRRLTRPDHRIAGHD